MIDILNMPKLESPFFRDDSTKWLVTDRITSGHEWVFYDATVLATEKLNGTDVSILISNGEITHVYNRENKIAPPFISANVFHQHVIRGLENAMEKGYCNLTDGQYFGELIGPDIQKNEYDLDDYIWIPFNTYARKKLSYNTWGKYPKDYATISTWFKENLWSLYYMMTHQGAKKFAEGIVFHQPSTGNMAKLRRDMYDWYKGSRHASK